jgi:hypothetical protein
MKDLSGVEKALAILGAIGLLISLYLFFYVALPGPTLPDPAHGATWRFVNGGTTHYMTAIDWLLMVGGFLGAFCCWSIFAELRHAKKKRRVP